MDIERARHIARCAAAHAELLEALTAAEWLDTATGEDAAGLRAAAEIHSIQALLTYLRQTQAPNGVLVPLLRLQGRLLAKAQSGKSVLPSLNRAHVAAAVDVAMRGGLTLDDACGSVGSRVGVSGEQVKNIREKLRRGGTGDAARDAYRKVLNDFRKRGMTPGDYLAQAIWPHLINTDRV